MHIHVGLQRMKDRTNAKDWTQSEAHGGLWDRTCGNLIVHEETSATGIKDIDQ